MERDSMYNYFNSLGGKGKHQQPHNGKSEAYLSCAEANIHREEIAGFAMASLARVLRQVFVGK